MSESEDNVEMSEEIQEEDENEAMDEGDTTQDSTNDVYLPGKNFKIIKTLQNCF